MQRRKKRPPLSPERFARITADGSLSVRPVEGFGKGREGRPVLLSGFHVLGRTKPPCPVGRVDIHHQLLEQDARSVGFFDGRCEKMALCSITGWDRVTKPSVVWSSS